jgi:dihydrodipicolinate synthase/N-acetylneuraminate lyase
MVNLEGLLPPLVTPFHPETLALDLSWMEAYLRFLEDSGASGVLVLGTTGEFPLLSLEEKLELVDDVLARRGRLRVLVGANATSFREAARIARHAVDGGADGVLVLPSFYYPSPPDEGVVRYFDRVLEGISIPALAYHIPQVSGVPVAAPLARCLRDVCGLVGVKDSSGDSESLRAFCSLPGFRVFTGNDRRVLEGLELGAAGAITAASNAFPDAVAQVVRAFREGRDARAAQGKLDRIRELLFEAPPVPAPAVVKYLLELRGFPASGVRPPLRSPDASERDLLRRRFEEIERG